MANSFCSSPKTIIIDTNFSVRTFNDESIKCERESMRSNTEIAIKPIPISPYDPHGDEPISVFDWKEGVQFESRESFQGSIVSNSSEDEIMDEEQSYQSNEFDSPLDYRVDWTPQMKMSQNQLDLEENNYFEMEDTFKSLEDDDVSILDVSEETFDKEEMTSLTTWMKSNGDVDIWVI